MAERRPLILLSGLISELPSGDVVLGGTSSIQIVTGSGLEGGNFISSLPEVAVDLLPEPSGLIFVDNKLANDGVAFRDAQVANVSGNLYYDLSLQVLESGNTTLELAVDALASGNAALELVANQARGGTRIDAVAAIDINEGDVVGFNDAGQVETIRRVLPDTILTMNFGPAIFCDTNDRAYTSFKYNELHDKFVTTSRGPSSYMYAQLAEVTSPRSVYITPGLQVMYSLATTYGSTAYSPELDIYVRVFERNDNNDVYANVFRIMNNNINHGAGVSVFAGTTTHQRVFHIRDEYFLVTFVETANKFTAKVVSANNYLRLDQWGDTATIVQGNIIAYNYDIVSIPGEDKLVMTYRSPDDNQLKSVIIGVDLEELQVISVSPEFDMIDQTSSYVNSAYDPSRRRVVTRSTTFNRANILIQNLDPGFSTVTPVGSGFGLAPTSSVDAPDSFRYDKDNDIYYTHQAWSSRPGLAVFVPSGDSDFSLVATGIALNDNSPNYVGIDIHKPTNQIAMIYTQNGGQYLQLADNAYNSNITRPTVNGFSNFLGIASNSASSGDTCSVLLSSEEYILPSGNFTTGEPLYLDFAGSGVRSYPYPEPSWSGQVPWQPVAQATSASGFLLINQL